MKLSYKDYTTILKRDRDFGIWHGRVAGIQDVVTFEAKTWAEAKQEFYRSVDAYLHFCHSINRLPNKPADPRRVNRLLRKLMVSSGRIKPLRLKLR